MVSKEAMRGMRKGAQALVTWATVIPVISDRINRPTPKGGVRNPMQTFKVWATPQ
jgi:hypothetical protein